MEKFPEEFIFGVTTSAFQTEGADSEDGKGESIWDKLLKTRPDLVRDGSKYDKAADGYHLYKEDVKMISDMKFNAYKFSISWSRILPNGTISSINQIGITYYQRLIDEIIEQGIIPMVTLYHFDLPEKLQQMGGWCNPLIVDYFEDYARLLFKTYGNQVKWWTTFNEPLEIVSGYTDCRYAPYLSLECFDADYIVGHNILKAHAKVYRMYRSEFYPSQNGKVSIILSGMNFIPKTESEEDRKAALIARQFTMGWFAHPIYSSSGDYPPVMRKMIDEKSSQLPRSKLPEFSAQEIEQIKGSSDFFAFNHYTSSLASFSNKGNFFRFRYTNVATELSSDWPKTGAHWCKVAPFGMKDILLWIQKEFNNPPIYIYENGFCDHGKIKDVERINFFKAYLKNVLEAINEHKVNVIGYHVWTLIDGFEWLNGYSHKYGIIHVDFDNPRRTRTPKLSAKFWENVCQFRAISEENYS